jgi:hypothetical protein
MFVNGQLDFNELSTVKMYYDLGELNFFVGIISGLILLILFAIAAIVFIQRLFDIVLLYIISPVSVSTIPLDDGQRFKIWREMLVSKILGAYGIIFAMNLFFIITPLLTGIKFFDSNFQNGIMRLLILIGGAFAVTKANLVISQLTGNNAGTQEAQQMLSNIHMGYRAVRGAVGATSAVAGRMIGGSDFMKNKKKGMGLVENTATVAKSGRNQRDVSDQTGERTKKQKAGAVTRLATMPPAMLKDLCQGGLLTMGRNFVPRLKNAFAGRSLFSRADVKKGKGKTPKESGQDNATNSETAADDNAQPVVTQPETET